MGRKSQESIHYLSSRQKAIRRSLIRLAALFSATTTVFPGAIYISIVAGLDACPAAVASQNARCSVVIENLTGNLSDNDLPVLDSETTGIPIRKRRAGHHKQHSQTRNISHRVLR
jgi:hypothetical protein